MRIVVTGITSRGPCSKYRAALSVSLPLILQFPWWSNDMLPTFSHLIFLLAFSVLDWRHTAGKGMELSCRLVLGPFSLLVESEWYSPSIWMNNTLSYDHQTHMLSTPYLPFCNHACSAWASDNTHILFAEGEVGGIALLVGYLGVWLSLTSLQLKGSIHWLSLHLILTLLSQSPFYLTSDDKDLRIRLELLGYKKHLDLHPQALLESPCSDLLIGHHVWLEPA